MTIGASSAAFYHAYHECIRCKRGYAWRKFISGFKGNFAKATKMQLVFSALKHSILKKMKRECEAIFVNSALYSVRKMCEALRVKQCQYYQWIRQRANREKRKIRGMWLVEVIRRIFHENREVYGCRKMKIALQAEGICISEWKIRRIMRENGLYPQTKKKWKPYKKAKSEGFYSENKVKRHFLPNRFNTIWAGDITYIPTNLGWVYLAAVLDMKNKEVIGYEVSRNIDSELCKRALSNALALRGKHEGLIFHSDRGSQYSSRAYKRMLQENGIEGPMSAPGCPYDNSCVESFFATLKKELIFRRQYATIEEVKTDLYRYIELFYNRKRLHSTLGYMSPVAHRLAFMQ